MNPKVDFYFNKAEKWQEEIKHLRTLVLAYGLNEELKWGVPTYTFHTDKIVLIHTFKDYCAVLFFKGVLLNDSEGVLIQQTENVQSARQMRFTSLKQIVEMESVLKTYIYEAVEVEKAGLKVEFKKTAEFNMPEEFQQQLDKNNNLKTAFENLTPGRQRAYLLHFSAPKQAKTRETRVEKAMEQILKGKGLND
ncbi:MAG: YdeI/OmpD-associated family protein [Bacteroidota bacterium]